MRGSIRVMIASSFLLLALGVRVFGQEQVSLADLEKALYHQGFEQVHIRERGDSLQVFFEHREFRNPKHSMEYASRILEQYSPAGLSYVPLYHNQPMGEYAADRSWTAELTREDYRYFKANNKFSDYRFHIRLVPSIAANFGYYDKPVRAKTSLILDTRWYFMEGISLQSGLLIPIQNSLDAQDLQPRLAPSQLSIFRHLARSHYAFLSLGTFFNNRYGGDLQYRFAPINGRWSFGAELALTGYYHIQDGKFYTEVMDDLMLTADVEYRTPIEDVSLKLMAGQFLYEDIGARLDMIKQFGNVDIGLFGSVSKAGTNIGFQFAFPLWPGKILRGRKVELRTTEEFRWEYSYNNEDLVNQSFRTGMPRLSDITRQYNGHFIRGK